MARNDSNKKNTNPKKTTKVSTKPKSRKKRITKKKYKGVRYIAKKLLQYYPKRYPKFSNALIRAREIFELIQSAPAEENLKVNLKSIFKFERKHRTKKEEEPELTSFFEEQHEFFDVLDIPSRISDELPPNVFVVSNISRSELPMLQGAKDNEQELLDETGMDLQEEYFNPFLRYCNILASSTKNKYPVKLRFRKYSEEGETKWTKKDGKWILYLEAVMEDGTDFHIGFDKENPSLNPLINITPDNYDSLKYNELRKLASSRGISQLRPTSESLKRALREQDELQNQRAKELKQEISSKESQKQKTTESSLSEKEAEARKIEAEARKIEAEAKKLAEQNKATELELEKRKLDIEEVKLGLMTKEEFRKKWGK